MKKSAVITIMAVLLSYACTTPRTSALVGLGVECHREEPDLAATERQALMIQIEIQDSPIIIQIARRARADPEIFRCQHYC